MNKKSKHTLPNPAQTTIPQSIYWFIAALSVLLYINTLNHGYVLDDESLLVNNTLTESGFKHFLQLITTGYRSSLTYTDYELYRPIPKICYALFWQIAPANPTLPHFVNILVYTVCCLLLFKTLTKSLQFDTKIALITTLLFTAHPIHTEVVANAKSLDELMALMFSLIGINYLFAYFNNAPKYVDLIISGFFFMLAMLSKESAVAIVIISPLLVWWTKRVSFAKITPLIILISSCIFTYFIIRQSVLTGTPDATDITTNYLVGISSWTARTANSLYIIAVYLQQLILPINLTSDASLATFSSISILNWKLLVALVLISFLVFSIYTKRKHHTYALLGALFFCITLTPVSNLFILIGTNYGERLLFIPSIGFCLWLSSIITDFIQSQKQVSIFNTALPNKQAQVILVITVLFGLQTVARNMDWKNNQTLFSSDVQKVPQSARMQAYFANATIQPSYLASVSAIEQPNKVNEAIQAFKKAIQIVPTFHKAQQSLAQLYQQVGDSVNAELYFKESIKNDGKNPFYLNSYGNFLFAQRRYTEAEKAFRQSIMLKPNFAEAWMNLGSIIANDAKTSIMQSTNSDIIPTMITDKLIIAKLDSALACFNKAQKIDPQFAEPWYYSRITWILKGNKIQADADLAIYNELKSQQERRLKLLAKAQRQ
jgi:Tfp pilus assembly protein PilF